MAGTNLTNAEIASLRTYFKSPGFKYPACEGDPMPPGWERWGMIYFNALPRLLEEVLQRRFHLRYNEAPQPAGPMPCGVIYATVAGTESVCEEPIGHDGPHFSRRPADA